MKVTLPLTKEICENLHAGDSLQLSGIIYTARDAAQCKRCNIPGTDRGKS